MKVVLDAFEAPELMRIRDPRACLAVSMARLSRATRPCPPAPRALNALGPAYIKFGQVLSTRPDVVGE